MEQVWVGFQQIAGERELVAVFGGPDGHLLADQWAEKTGGHVGWCPVITRRADLAAVIERSA